MSGRTPVGYPRQVRIRMETEACEALFAEAESRQADLVWSFMH